LCLPFSVCRSRGPHEGRVARMRKHPLLRTRRLELISGTPALIRAEMDDRERFGELLDATIPEGWPPEDVGEATMEFMAQWLEEGPEQAGWWCWYFVLKDEGAGGRVLIGNGGFKGRPSRQGTVEVGYAIHPSFRESGYATEAVKALVGWAFRQPRVERVVAETEPGNRRSRRVLEKAGFVRRGKASQSDLIRFEIG
jgi:ribosomal-protein-alanine N-acetyltransferase